MVRNGNGNTDDDYRIGIRAYVIAFRWTVWCNKWILYTLQAPLRSMQLQNYIFSWQERFHGIPCNCSCHRNWRSPSSGEFYGISWNCICHQNWCNPSSIEFHGTVWVIEVGIPQVPWNCIEALNYYTSSKFPMNPSNFIFTILMKWEISWYSLDLIDRVI